MFDQFKVRDNNGMFFAYLADAMLQGVQEVLIQFRKLILEGSQSSKIGIKAGEICRK